MSEKLVIKKYANRRLYDTQTSSYITQDDLFNLAKQGADFEVIDVKTGEDLTRQVLTQIIFEEESKKTVPLLPVSFLKGIIKLYDNKQNKFVPDYLDKTLEAFYSFEKNSLETIAQKNVELMQNSFQMFNPFVNLQKATKTKEQRIKELEEELAELKNKD